MLESILEDGEGFKHWMDWEVGGWRKPKDLFRNKKEIKLAGPRTGPEQGRQ